MFKSLNLFVLIMRVIFLDHIIASVKIVTCIVGKSIALFSFNLLVSNGIVA